MHDDQATLEGSRFVAERYQRGVSDIAVASVLAVFEPTMVTAFHAAGAVYESRRRR